MEIKYVFVALAAVLLVGIVAASAKINLDPLDGSDASGTADIKVKEKDGFHEVKIKVDVKNVELMEGYVLEGWLVDEDTGYKLSTGGFTVDSDGDGKMRFKQNLVNFDLYDLVVITAEPAGDVNPNPNTPIVGGAI